MYMYVNLSFISQQYSSRDQTLSSVVGIYSTVSHRSSGIGSVDVTQQTSLTKTIQIILSSKCVIIVLGQISSGQLFL